MIINRQIETLYQAFSLLNENKFENLLPTPTITIQSKGKRSDVTGWCSVKPIWKTISDEKSHEINISAEYADRPFLEIIETLLHEMVHLSNATQGIKDCSRNNQYHNNKFKEKAESIGMTVTHTDKLGWASTSLSEELINLIKSWKLDETVFDNARLIEADQTTHKSSTRKWICPECNITVRSTKEVNIMCMDCNCQLEEN